MARWKASAAGSREEEQRSLHSPLDEQQPGLQPDLGDHQLQLHRETWESETRCCTVR